MEFILGEEEHTCDNDKEIAIVMCEVCSKEVRKYKCPRCGVSTCSMQCCKNHKIASGCTGKRERIQYVAVNEFTDKHLRADYHFLEDVLQTRVGAKRNFTHLGGIGQDKKTPKPSSGSVLESMTPTQNLSMYSKCVKLLVKAALERGTKILLQPNGMTKRKENTSRYDARQDIIYWKLAAIFLLKEEFEMPKVLGLDVNSQSVDQVQILSAPAVCLSMHQTNDKLSIGDIKAKLFSSIPSGTLLRQALKPLQTLSPQLKCFIRILPSQADNPIFKSVDDAMLLRDALAGMTVIEFPTLFFGTVTATSKFRVLVDEPLISLPPKPKIVEIDDEADEVDISESSTESSSNGEEEDTESSDGEDEGEEEDGEDVDHDDRITARNDEVPFQSLPAVESVAKDKKVTFGGSLIADYGSSDDSEEDGEVVEIPLPPGASNKYKEFMQQLVAHQLSSQDQCRPMEEE